MIFISESLSLHEDDLIISLRRETIAANFAVSNCYAKVSFVGAQLIFLNWKKYQKHVRTLEEKVWVGVI